MILGGSRRFLGGNEIKLMALWCWPERQTCLVNIMLFVWEVNKRGNGN